MRGKKLVITCVMAHGLLELLVVKKFMLYGNQSFIAIFNTHILIQLIQSTSSYEI